MSKRLEILHQPIKYPKLTIAVDRICYKIPESYTKEEVDVVMAKFDYAVKWLPTDLYFTIRGKLTKFDELVMYNCDKKKITSLSLTHWNAE